METASIPTGSRPVASPEPLTGLVAHQEAPHVCESCNGASLKWLARHQNPDGSWGSGAEIFEGHLYTETTATALAILSLISAGYTYLSRDKIHDRESDRDLCFGQTIKAGIKWLASHEPADPFESALVALVMNQTCSMTDSAIMRSLSDAASNGLEAFQRFDAARGDSLGEAWGAAALVARKASHPDFEGVAWDRTAGGIKVSLESAPKAETAAAYLLLTKDREHPALHDLAVSLAASPPDWENPAFTQWYFGSLALFQLEGPVQQDPAGESWKSWSLAMRDVLVRNQDRDGSWPGLSGATGSAVRTAMGTLSLEVYYRYSNALGVR